MEFKNKIGLNIFILGVILVLIVIIFFYIESSKKYALLDINNVDSLNDPGILKIVEVTKACNDFPEIYIKSCYVGIAWSVGSLYGKDICDKINYNHKGVCYEGYGFFLMEKKGYNLDEIRRYCLETDYYSNCMGLVIRISAERDFDYLDPAVCEKFLNLLDIPTEIFDLCYQGIGRQIAFKGEDPLLCDNFEYREQCLIGYIARLDQLGAREEALEICYELSEYNKSLCLLKIAMNSMIVHNKSLEEAFIESDNYQDSYKDNYLEGIIVGFSVNLTRGSMMGD